MHVQTWLFDLFRVPVHLSFRFSPTTPPPCPASQQVNQTASLRTSWASASTLKSAPAAPSCPQTRRVNKTLFFTPFCSFKYFYKLKTVNDPDLLIRNEMKKECGAQFQQTLYIIHHKILLVEFVFDVIYAKICSIRLTPGWLLYYDFFVKRLICCHFHYNKRRFLFFCCF